MSDEYQDLFQGASYRAGRDLQASIEANRAEQQRYTEEVAARIQDANELKARRQAERDELQRENVRLLKEQADREHARDEQAKTASQAERTRKRRELYRWVFTTLIALAGLAVAIIALATR